jgi:hypothetical protein
VVVVIVILIVIVFVVVYSFNQKEVALLLSSFEESFIAIIVN